MVNANQLSTKMSAKISCELLFTPFTERLRGPCVCGWKMEMKAVMASHNELYEAMYNKVKQSKISSFFSKSASFDHCDNFQPGTQMLYQ